MGTNVSELPSSVHKYESGSSSGGSPSKQDGASKEARDGYAKQKRLSVRDLATKFEKGQGTEQAATPKVAADPVKPKDKNMTDRESQLKKLRNLLNDLQGRVAGRNKDDIQEALSTIEALAVIYSQQETELAQEKGETEKLGLQLKQTSVDAKTMVEEARAVAKAAIEAADRADEKLQNALDDQKKMWTTTEIQELEELKKEAHEVQRIKMLHESSKVVDMEREIDDLKHKLAEKVAENSKLREELEMFKLHKQVGGKLPRYQLTGHAHLGSTLSIVPVDSDVSDLSLCSIQWFRLSTDGSATDLILGAMRPQYAPEPFDVGRFLRAEISLPSGKTDFVQTSGPIDPAPGLDNYVEVLVSKGSAQFNARIVLKNGKALAKQSLHTLDVNKSRIKLHNAHSVKAKETYSSSMQFCGARGGGDSAAQGLFWVAKKGSTFMLVLESERERNAAILLARKFARLNNIDLGGPDDMSMAA